MNKIVSLSESSPQISNIDKAKFVRFMQQTPIWDYFKITQHKYLSYSVEEKTALISEYYKYMEQGKRCI